MLVAGSPALRSDAFGARCRYSAGAFFKGGFSLTVGSEYFGPRQGNAFGFAQAAPELSPAGGRAGLLLRCESYGAELLQRRSPMRADAQMHYAAWEAQGV